MSAANGNGATAEIVRYERPSAQTALEPNSVNEAFYLAEKLVQSGLLGRSIQKPESALAIILAGRELGLTAMQSLRSIHIIEGKPTLSADLMVALVKRSPTCQYFKLVESTAKIATYETDRAGEGVTRMSFTVEQAQNAGLMGKDNWRKYTDAMLRARCIAALARAVYPDLLAGIYEPDELEREPAPVARVVSARQPERVKVEEPVQPAPEEQTDDEKIAQWTKRIGSVTNAAELAEVRKAIEAMPRSQRVRDALNPAYLIKKKALIGKAAPEPKRLTVRDGETGEVIARGDGDEAAK